MLFKQDACCLCLFHEFPLRQEPPIHSEEISICSQENVYWSGTRLIITFLNFLYMKSPLYTQKRSPLSPFAHRKTYIGVVPDSQSRSWIVDGYRAQGILKRDVNIWEREQSSFTRFPIAFLHVHFASAFVNHAHNQRMRNGTFDLLWVMSHMGMRNKLCTHWNTSCHTWKWVMSHVGQVLSHMGTNESYHTREFVTDKSHNQRVWNGLLNYSRQCVAAVCCSMQQHVAVRCCI